MKRKTASFLLVCAFVIQIFYGLSFSGVGAKAEGSNQAWVAPEFWEDAYVIDEADDIYALARIINLGADDPTFDTDVLRFITDDTFVVPVDTGAKNTLADQFASSASKFVLTASIDIPDTSEFAGIGTTSRPFGASVNGGGFSITYALNSSNPSMTDNSRYGFIRYASTPLFYNISFEGSLTIANGPAADFQIGGIAANASGKVTAENVRVNLNLTMTGTTANPTVSVGGIVGFSQTKNVETYGVTTNISTTYTGAMNKITEGRIFANLVDKQAGKVVVQPMPGISMYVFGNRVVDNGDGTFTAPTGTRVTAVAVNESMKFASWNVDGITQPAAQMTAVFTMPAGGVVLGCNVQSSFAAGETFANPYTIDDGADLLALQAIINKATPVAADNPNFQRFGLTWSAANRLLLQKGYFKITDNFIADLNNFTGVGTGGAAALASTGTNVFFGNIDGGNFNVTLANQNMASNYCGLLGTIGTTNASYAGLHSVIRNLSVSGQIYTEPTGASYLGGIAANARYAIIDNCVSSVEINGSKTRSGCYLGGIAGFATNSFIKNCKVTNVAGLRISSFTSGALYLGGAVGYIQNSNADGIRVELGSNPGGSGYKDTVFEAQGLSANVSMGGVFGFVDFDTAALTGTLKNILLTTMSPDDSTLKTLSARSTGQQVTCGGIAGKVSTKVQNAYLENVKIDMGNSSLEIIAQDTNTAGTEAITSSAGGIAGFFSHDSLANMINLITDTKTMFKGNISILSMRYGGGSGFAGGISGRNIPTFIDTDASEQDGRTTFDLSGLKIQTVHKGSYKVTGATSNFAGGLCGSMQGLAEFASLAPVYVLNNVKITGTNTLIEVLREGGNTARDAKINFGAGGIAGTYGAGGVSNSEITLTDSSINAHQLSYDSPEGDVSCGGAIGIFSGTTFDNVSVKTLGSTTISGTSSTKKGLHGVSDIYVGGMIGYATSASLVANKMTFAGDYASNPSVRSVSLVGNNSANSPCVGGLIGYATGPKVRNSSVQNAYIYGEAYNIDLSAADTDIIVGGAVGLMNGDYRAIANACVANTVVKDSKVEAYGREYTLTYAGGIIGSTYGGNYYVSDNCVTQNNYILAFAQKKWAAVGGIQGYHYDSTNYLINCASIDNVLEARATGDVTAFTDGSTTKYFESIPMAGGIVGKAVSAGDSKNGASGTGVATSFTNCYSNSVLKTVNPAGIMYRGGLIGYDRNNTSAGGITVNNSFFDSEKAGTIRAVDLCDTSVKTDYLEYGQKDYDTPVKMGATANKISEIYTHSALDFSLIPLVTPANILINIQKGGVGTNPSAPATVRVAPRNASLVEIGDNESTAEPTPYGFVATKLSGSDVITYADMFIKVNNVEYKFGSKPLYLGNHTVTGVDLYKTSEVEENKIENNTTHITISGGNSLDLFADVLYSDGTEGLDIVTWEFSETSDFSKLVTLSNALSYAGITVSGEDGSQLTIKSNTAIDAAKTLYVRARSVMKDSSGSTVTTYYVKLTIEPKYVTGIAITGGINDDNSITNPMSLDRTTYKKVFATVYPTDATLTSYNIVGYKVNQDTKEITSTTLRGVKSDGTISPQELIGTGTDQIALNDIFVIRAISHGKVAPDASGFTAVNPGDLNPDGSRTAISKPVYAAVTTSANVIVHCTDGTPDPASERVPNRTNFNFTTKPLTALYSPKPQTAYYLINGTTKIDIPLTAGDTSNPDATYSFDSLTGTSSYSIKVPDGADKVDVYVVYFLKVDIRYYSISNSIPGQIGSGSITQYVNPEDIMAAPTRTGYDFAGWYVEPVLSGTAALSAYGNKLVPSSTEIVDGEPVFHDLLPIKGEQTSISFYARWQYHVEQSDSASLSPAYCGNADLNDTNQSAPVNMYSNYVLNVRYPDSYVGRPQVKVVIGDTETIYTDVKPALVPVYELNAQGNKVKVGDELCAQIDIPTSKLPEDNIGSGIKITTYHTNGMVLSNEDKYDSEVSVVNSQIPAVSQDGIFSVVYDVYHARTRDSSNNIIKKTYAYENLDEYNLFKFSLDNALPKGSVIRIYRRLLDSPKTINEPFNQQIYYLNITDANSAQKDFALNEFTKIGENPVVTPGANDNLQTFRSYLASRDKLCEQFFVEIIPPTYYHSDNSTLLSNLNVKACLGAFNLSALGYLADNSGVPASAKIGVQGLQKPQLSVIGAATPVSGKVQFTSDTKIVGDTRHANKALGIILRFYDGGNLLSLPVDTEITIGANKYTCSEETPYYQFCYSTMAAVTQETYTIDCSYSVKWPAEYTPPSGLKLVVQLMEVDRNCVSDYLTLDDKMPKLSAGELKYAITIQ